MSVREPTVAGRFYPGTSRACQEMIAEFPQKNKKLQGLPLGGIVPHAGWIYSGAIASSVFQTLRQMTQDPIDTLIFFGAVHVHGVHEATLSTDEFWKTPLGNVAIDQELAQKLPLTRKKSAHEQEHSIEVQLPLIQTLFPEAKILPIAVPPNAQALQLGPLVAQTAKQLGRRFLLIGSSDLTHYGESYYFTPKGEGFPALDWVKNENDARMVDLILHLDAEHIIPEAKARHNACGSGAITATLAGIRQLYPNAQGVLSDYATSFDVKPDPVPTLFVGYAGVVLFH